MTTLVAEITREGDKLKMSAFEKAKGIDVTIKHYSECNISSQQIKILCDSITHLFNKANRQHGQENDFVDELKKNGRALFDHLLTAEVKKVIQKSESKFLLLSIDEQLVQIPWELLFDGEEFLCIRFAMGRTVRTKQKISDNKLRGVNKPVKMLITADPIGDLDSAYKEGISIRNEMDKRKNKINVLSRTGDVSLDFIKKNIRDYDIVHFAGHAEYNTSNPSESGWLLKDGTFTAKDIVELGTTASLPSIVFSNACQSGQTEEWEIEEGFEEKIYGLANAFLLAGVRHYIGTFWKVMDEPCYYFANEFYKNVIDGTPIGEAVRLARIQLINKYGYESIVWSSYMLYGDPSINLFFFPAIKKSLKESIFKNQIAILSILLGSIIGTGILGWILYKNYFLANKTTEWAKSDTILIMPFKNINKNNNERYIGFGIANLISEKLDRLKNVVAINVPSSILQFNKDSDCLDKTLAIKVADVMGVNKVIMGTFEKKEDRVKITAYFLKTSDQSLTQIYEIIGSYKNLPKMINKITGNAIKKINVKITIFERLGIIKVPFPKNLSAYNAFSKYIEANANGNWQKGVCYCHQALVIDPNYIQAYLALATNYIGLERMDLVYACLSKALTLSKKRGDLMLLGNTYLLLGEYFYRDGKWESSLLNFNSTVEIAHKLNDRLGYLQALCRMAMIYLCSGDYYRSKKLLLDSENFCKEINNKYILAEVYINFAIYYDLSKETDINCAEEYLLRALNIYQSVNDKYGILNILFMQALLEGTRMEYDEAYIKYRECLKLSQEINDKRWQASIYNSLGKISLPLMQSGQGKAEYDPKEYYEKSLNMYKEIRNWNGYKQVLFNLVDFCISQRLYTKGIQYTEVCIKKAEDTKDRNSKIKGLFELGEIFSRMKLYDKAILNYDMALKLIAGKTFSDFSVEDVYISLGKIYKLQKNNDKSNYFFNKALEINLKTDNFLSIGDTYRKIGDAYKETNNIQQAIENYNSAISYFEKEQGLISMKKAGLLLSYRQLAECYRAEGSILKAVEYLKKALLIAEEIKYPSINSVKSELYNLRFFMRGIGMSMAKLKMNKIDYGYYNKARNLVLDQQYNRALAILNKLYKKRNYYDVRDLIIFSYKLTGGWQQAINIILNSSSPEIKSRSDCYTDNLDLMECYYSLGDCENAAQCFQKARDASLEYEEVAIERLVKLYVITGEMLIMLENYNGTLTFIKTALELLGNCEETYYFNKSDYVARAYLVISEALKKQGDKKQAQEYAEKALAITEQVGNMNINQIYISLGKIYKDIDIIKAIEFLDRAIDSLLSFNDSFLLGKAYFERGNLYEIMASNDKAVEDYKHSLSFAEKYNDIWTMISNYDALHRIYKKIKQSKLADEYNNKYVKVMKKVNTGFNVREYYLTKEELSKKIKEKAKENTKENTKEKIKSQYKENVVNIYRAMGFRFLHNEHYKRAVFCFEKIILIMNENKNEEGLLTPYRGLAGCYIMKNDWSLALDYCKKVTFLAEKYNYTKVSEQYNLLIQGIEDLLKQNKDSYNRKSSFGLIMQNIKNYLKQDKDSFDYKNL